VEPEVLSTKVTKTAGTKGTKTTGTKGAKTAGTSPMIVPEFFEAALCERIRRAMDAGVPEPAEILGDAIGADAAVRRSSHIEVDAATLRLVEHRLDLARDDIGRSLGLRLTAREGTSFLRYQPGGFFKPHRDRGDVPSWPGAARRRASVVVFLNTATEASAGGAFSGGTLTLYAEGPQPSRVDLHPQAGTLVAFPASLLHEVTPVGDGIRDTLVDWFY
jgi:predicted 2-oxoglutarate/Fe(II)-dependent dioxygenase YbiX